MRIPKYSTLPAILIAGLVIATSAITAYRSPRGSNDFDTYYNAGKAVLEKTPLYYTGDYHKETGDIGPFLYPPAAACFLAPVAALPIIPAAILWNLLNIGFFAFCTFAILNLSDKNGSDLKRKWLEQSLLIKILSIVTAGALLLDNLTMAQINIFIFFLALSALWLWKKNRPFLAGIVLASSILIKLTPLLFCIFFFFRKEWKVLAGALLGGILLTAVLPTGIFGLETNRLYHRQWLGRTIKPLLVNYVPAWKNQTPHPQKKTVQDIANIQLANVLTVKNQSLQSALTRLCLKDRNGYAYSTAFPIYAAQKYPQLPVLLPLEPPLLMIFIRVIQAGLLGLLILLSLKTSCQKGGMAVVGILSLYFLSLPLFSPVARSHQFITWLFAVYGLLYFPPGRWRALGWAGCAVYFLQALPYGKAIGFGAWGNLLLWISFAGMLINLKLENKNPAALT